jgi:hypothetical protein
MDCKYMLRIDGFTRTLFIDLSSNAEGLFALGRLLDDAKVPVHIMDRGEDSTGFLPLNKVAREMPR